MTVPATHEPGPRVLARWQREVVASYWNLNSAAAGTLMREFYASLLSGAPTAESLRRAAAAVRSRRPYAHPYYRAGLEVFSMN